MPVKPLEIMFSKIWSMLVVVLIAAMVSLLVVVMQFLNVMKVVDLPMWIFYLLAAVYPVFLVCRTAWINSLAQRARNYLESQKVKQTDAILFRMSVDEIKMLARRQMPQGNDLRWQLLNQRLNAREE